MRGKRRWKPLWVILILICLFISLPYIINCIVQHNGLPLSSYISGETEIERTWLVFWASYIGCVLSSIVTFTVLYLTLRQNNDQNQKNRDEAHHENELIRDAQVRAIKYERAMQHVAEIRSCAVAIYLAVVNSKTEDVYSSISLENLKDIDFRVIRARLLEIQEESNRAYVEMQMLLSYSAGRDDETDKYMDVIKQMSDEIYDCIRDLIWLFIECKHSLSVSQEVIQSEVYKYASEHSGRLKIPNYKFIWDIIIENNLMNIEKNRSEIVSKWHDERQKIDQLLLLSLRGLVSHYYVKAQEIKV